MATLPEIDAFTHDNVFLGAAHGDNARRTLWVVAPTAGMMVVEIVAGYLTGSMALLADGFHMATHAGALGVAAAAYAFAKRHASNPTYSFGPGKVGDLAGFASALVLGLIALGIGVESILRLFQPITVAFGEATIIAVVGLGVNVAGAFLLSGGIIAGTIITGTTTAMLATSMAAITTCARPMCTSSRTRLPRSLPSRRC